MLGGFALGLRRSRRVGGAADADRAPLVTIFKPLAGADDELDVNLESFARIDYPAFEVLFGVASPEDAALPAARRFVARHPEIQARIVVTDPDNAINPKVAQLISLDSHARGDVVVISDSNVRVAKDYLWSLVHELLQPGVGLATNAFAGTGERSLGAALENLQIGGMITPGIVATAALTKRPLTVGKSMGMWRRDLVRMGGFRRVGEVLAEDHLLGRLFLEAGLGVRTSLAFVENRNVDCSVKRTIERHTRWAKMRRALSPIGFAFEPMLSPLATASIVAMFAQSKVSVEIMVAMAALQTVCSLASTRMLRGHALKWYYAPLEIVRTYLLLLCWARACMSRGIDWRGHAFVIKRDSRIAPAPKSSWSRLRDAARRFA
jgi:ceramide glucosyltransferase